MKINKRKMKDVMNQINTKKVSIIGIIIVSIIAVTVILILNSQKEETIKEYGGMVFNKEMDQSSVNLIESSDEEPIQVPVPKGYTASSVESERTVNGGFVIYEGEEEVIEANLEEAKRTRNQFVWIPIEDSADMYYMSGNNMYGAYYEFAATGYTRKTATNEPVLKGYDKEGTYLTKYMNGITQEKFLKEMQQSFYEMIKSVETYGGYYIGRYETGGVKTKEPKVVKLNEDIHSITWYDSYKKGKWISKNEKVTTHMMWGIQYDEALKWIIDTETKTNEEVAKDSTSWGNYENATFEYTTASGGTSTKSNGSQTRIPTGSSEYTVANNIYDLAGNVWEWTMEGSGFNADYRYYRGGRYSYTGLATPVHSRYSDSPYDSYDVRRFQGGTLYPVALSPEEKKLKFTKYVQNKREALIKI